MFSKITLILMFLFLSGCFLTKPSSTMPLGVSPLMFGATAEVVSVMNTKKTLGDHVSSAILKKDCSTPRSQIDNGPVCRDYIPPPKKRPPVYCYRTLATPDCYLEPSRNFTDVRIGYPL